MTDQPATSQDTSHRENTTWLEDHFSESVTGSDDHQRLAYRSAPLKYGPFTFKQCELMHAILGLTSEVGELADAVKKHVIYGRPLDEENIAEEVGDVDWYAGLILTAVRQLRSDIQESNIAKLRKRYPEGYSDFAATARADKHCQTCGGKGYLDNSFMNDCEECDGTGEPTH